MAEKEKRPLHTRKQFPIGPADWQPGERRLVVLDGKRIGVFNVNGRYFALHNRCPHMAGSLCEGPVTGTTLPTGGYAFVYGRQGEIIRCAWHGWEFEIATGQCLIDPKIRARTYPVTVEAGQIVVHI
jgi:3-phenylpropionate/trans-cinnamate dioxygenase ferredoxin subunit